MPWWGEREKTSGKETSRAPSENFLLEFAVLLILLFFLCMDVVCRTLVDPQAPADIYSSGSVDPSTETAQDLETRLSSREPGPDVIRMLDSFGGFFSVLSVQCLPIVL